MSLRDHLRELRRRVVFSIVGVAIGSIVGWIVYAPVFDALQRPLIRLAAERGGLIAVNFAGIATSFDMRIKISLFLGVLLSSPWWVYQLWAFVTPGLTKRERRYAVGFVAAGAPLFLVGAFLAWLVLPNAVAVLTNFTPKGAANLIDAQVYLSFVMRVVLAFGLAFLLPVLMVALNFAGLVSAKAWFRGWRWAVLGIFVFAAVMTPTPDAITMLLVAIPMCGLYFGAIGICAWRDRRRASTPPSVSHVHQSDDTPDDVT
jgi:sec-independent protein translocase protein TatC